MGVLDDAIREHLELKRKHGASDDEIAQQEVEALGPARRDPPPEPVEDEAAALAEEPAAAVEAPVAADGGDPDADLPAPGMDELAGAAQAPGPAELADEPPEPAVPLDAEAPEPDLPVEDEVPAEEQIEDDRSERRTRVLPTIDEGDEPPADDVVAVEPPLAPELPSDRPPVDEAPVDVEPVEPVPVETDAPVEEPPVAAGEAGEDVLEDTPDFLQDTPEHDRLWFEQKPPRDFDFD